MVKKLLLNFYLIDKELEKQLEGSIDKITRKEYFNSVKGKLLILSIKSLLKTDMTAHLGYQKGGSTHENKQRNGFFKKNHKNSKWQLPHKIT